MQWSLIAVIHIVNALFGASCASAENGKGQISSVFETFGYSPACVASALTSCEYSSTKELSVDVVNSIEVTKSLLEEMKSERENSASVVKTLHQEIKSERENSASVIQALLQEMKSEVQEVRQEMKSERENSTSIVKSLLQEMKSERENEKNNFEILLGNLEKITYRISTIEVILQKATSERKNASNSRSGMQSFHEYMKIKQENDFATTVNNSQDMLESLDAIKAGVNISNPQKNCADLRVLGDELSVGVQTVYPYFPNQKPVVVYCDQVTDGGGWTVIQSRSPLPLRENFTRNWDEYVKGFGDPKGEFWIGLDNIHTLTNSSQMVMRVDLEAAEGEKAWAQYGTFHVGDAASKYVLTIGNYSGDAGDGMADPEEKMWNVNGMMFSTQDNDNDLWPGINCAEMYKGGWWFNWCHVAHLNGLPIVGLTLEHEGIRWSPFREWFHSMKNANMKIRPVSLGL